MVMVATTAAPSSNLGKNKRLEVIEDHSEKTANGGSGKGAVDQQLEDTALAPPFKFHDENVSCRQNSIMSEATATTVATADSVRSSSMYSLPEASMMISQRDSTLTTWSAISESEQEEKVEEPTKKKVMESFDLDGNNSKKDVTSKLSPGTVFDRLHHKQKRPERLWKDPAGASRSPQNLNNPRAVDDDEVDRNTPISRMTATSNSSTPRRANNPWRAAAMTTTSPKSKNVEVDPARKASGPKQTEPLSPPRSVRTVTLADADAPPAAALPLFDHLYHQNSKSPKLVWDEAGGAAAQTRSNGDFGLPLLDPLPSNSTKVEKTQQEEVYLRPRLQPVPQSGLSGPLSGDSDDTNKKMASSLALRTRERLMAVNGPTSNSAGPRISSGSRSTTWEQLKQQHQDIFSGGGDEEAEEEEVVGGSLRGRERRRIATALRSTRAARSMSPTRTTIMTTSPFAANANNEDSGSAEPRPRRAGRRPRNGEATRRKRATRSLSPKRCNTLPAISRQCTFERLHRNEKRRETVWKEPAKFDGSKSPSALKSAENKHQQPIPAIFNRLYNNERRPEPLWKTPPPPRYLSGKKQQSHPKSPSSTCSMSSSVGGGGFEGDGSSVKSQASSLSSSRKRLWMPSRKSKLSAPQQLYCSPLTTKAAVSLAPAAVPVSPSSSSSTASRRCCQACMERARQPPLKKHPFLKSHSAEHTRRHTAASPKQHASHAAEHTRRHTVASPRQYAPPVSILSLPSTVMAPVMTTPPRGTKKPQQQLHDSITPDSTALWQRESHNVTTKPSRLKDATPSKSTEWKRESPGETGLPRRLGHINTPDPTVRKTTSQRPARLDDALSPDSTGRKMESQTARVKPERRLQMEAKSTKLEPQSPVKAAHPTDVKVHHAGTRDKRLAAKSQIFSPASSKESDSPLQRGEDNLDDALARFDAEVASPEEGGRGADLLESKNDISEPVVTVEDGAIELVCRPEGNNSRAITEQAEGGRLDKDGATCTPTEQPATGYPSNSVQGKEVAVAATSTERVQKTDRKASEVAHNPSSNDASDKPVRLDHNGDVEPASVPDRRTDGGCPTSAPAHGHEEAISQSTVDCVSPSSVGIEAVSAVVASSSPITSDRCAQGSSSPNHVNDVGHQDATAQATVVCGSSSSGDVGLGTAEAGAFIDPTSKHKHLPLEVDTEGDSPEDVQGINHQEPTAQSTNDSGSSSERERGLEPARPGSVIERSPSSTQLGPGAFTDADDRANLNGNAAELMKQQGTNESAAIGLHAPHGSSATSKDASSAAESTESTMQASDAQDLGMARVVIDKDNNRTSSNMEHQSQSDQPGKIPETSTQPATDCHPSSGSHEAMSKDEPASCTEERVEEEIDPKQQGFDEGVLEEAAGAIPQTKTQAIVIPDADNAANELPVEILIREEPCATTTASNMKRHPLSPPKDKLAPMIPNATSSVDDADDLDLSSVVSDSTNESVASIVRPQRGNVLAATIVGSYLDEMVPEIKESISMHDENNKDDVDPGEPLLARLSHSYDIYDWWGTGSVMDRTHSQEAANTSESSAVVGAQLRGTNPPFLFPKAPVTACLGYLFLKSQDT